MKKAEDFSGKAVTGVYLGFEFCENGLFHCDYSMLRETIQNLKKYGMRVIFVVPCLHERILNAFQKFLTDLLQDVEIDEVVVNDFGTLHMLRNNLKWMGLVSYGRFFEKSIREFRLNINDLLIKSDHINIVTEPTVMSGIYRILAKKYQVYAFETDTLPDGMLCTDNWEKTYEVHVHFPRIIVSKPAYCEYDVLSENCKEKFLFKNFCQGNCENYGKIIAKKGKRFLYKEGLCVFGIQEKTLEESIKGNYRLVYFGGGRFDENNCTH